MDDPLEDLYQEALAASREKQLQRENSYVADLIEILWPTGPAGISRCRAIEAMEQLRRTKCLPIPDSFEQTVQSAFNHHCIESAVFRRRLVPIDGLFSSRRHGNSTNWIVHRDRANAWLIAKNGTLLISSD